MPSAKKLLIRGTFRVQYPDVGIPAIPDQIRKQIALVVMYYQSYASRKPFYDAMGLEDEVQADGKICVGQFSLNVFAHGPFERSGEYVILCSLDTHLSNLVKVSVLS